MTKKVILTVILLCSCFGVSAQKVRTIADVDSLATKIYTQYEKQWNALGEEYQNTADSARRVAIEKQYTQSELKCNAEVLALYGKYPKITGMAERYFRLRTTMNKKELQKLYNKLPSNVRNSDAYAKGIRTHLDSRQVAVGDTVGSFRAWMPGGVEFRFGDLSRLKDVLVIFGGWDCMGTEAQLMLQLMYRKVDLSKLEIVSVFFDTDKAAFEQSVRAIGVPWVSVSDFKGELSPLNIAFGVQATPMCVYFSKDGCIEEITLGVTESILARIQAQSYGKTVEFK